MTLQGALDSFPLPDVLRLLAATGKTGGLHVTGPSASGTVWMVDGRVEHAVVGGQTAWPVDVVFQLMRNLDGTFRFDPGVPGSVPPAEGDGPRDVETILAAANDLLTEWDELAAVIPGADARVTLRPTVGADVVLTPSAWAVIAAVGDGTRVDDLAARIGRSELDALRCIRDLAVGGLLVVGPSVASPDPVRIGDLLDAATAPFAMPDRRSGGAPVPIRPGTLGPEDWAALGHPSTVGAAPAPVPPVPVPPVPVPPVPVPPAVAAASVGAEDDGEPVVGTGDVADGSFDRSVLFRFLGSVEG